MDNEESLYCFLESERGKDLFRLFALLTEEREEKDSKKKAGKVERGNPVSSLSDLCFTETSPPLIGSAPPFPAFPLLLR